MTFKPMLAASIKDDQLEKLLETQWVYASPKLDGIRGVVRDGVLLSRSLKPIRNKHVQARFGRPEYEGLDGELILGSPTADDVYRKTNSACMSIEGEPDVKFYVFDEPDGSDAFYRRHHCVRMRQSELPHTEMVLHKQIRSLADLTLYEAEVLSEGYEGLILRHPDRPYKHGRSTVKEAGMIKVKRFTDSEAEIIGMTELMHNANEAKVNALGHTERSSHKENKVPMGVMGTLQVRDLESGVEFEIGTGFTVADREWFWTGDVEGKIVKYKFFSIGVKDLPRHPVYLGLRDPMDM